MATFLEEEAGGETRQNKDTQFVVSLINKCEKIKCGEIYENMKLAVTPLGGT